MEVDECQHRWEKFSIEEGSCQCGLCEGSWPIHSWMECADCDMSWNCDVMTESMRQIWENAPWG